MNLPKLLKKCKLFNNFDDKQINDVFNTVQGRIVKYSPKTIVAKQDSNVTEIGVLLQGTLIKYITKKDGQKEPQASLEVGGLFGEVDGFSNTKLLSYSLVAAVEVTVLYITLETVVAHSSQNSPFHEKLLRNLLEIMATEIKGINKDTEYLLIKSMRLKVSKLIYDKYKEQSNLNVNLGLNRNEMAEYLNVSRPSMSREMQKMRDEGIIEYKKEQILIKNLKKLEAIVEAQ